MKVHSRMSFEIKEDNTISVEVEPSYDKPGEQSVWVGIKRNGQTVAELFFNEDQAAHFMRDFKAAMNQCFEGDPLSP